jgi:hypothetical protein
MEPLNMHGHANTFEEELVEVCRERDELRAALARFGRHLNLCSTYRDGDHQASPETACDCGLTAACRT